MTYTYSLRRDEFIYDMPQEGVNTMTTKEMLKTKIPFGMMFQNVAKLGKKANWVLVKSTFQK